MQNGATKKIKLVHKFALGVVVAALFCVGIFFAIKLQKQENTLYINDTAISIELATLSQERSRGLCCRDSLPENSGMLFVYDEPSYPTLWMKDVRIPLDMYWISPEKKIVHIEHAVQPESYPRRFRSPVPAQYILETNAGFAKTHNIQLGDTVSF